MVAYSLLNVMSGAQSADRVLTENPRPNWEGTHPTPGQQWRYWDSGSISGQVANRQACICCVMGRDGQDVNLVVWLFMLRNMHIFQLP